MKLILMLLAAAMAIGTANQAARELHAITARYAQALR